MRMPLRLGATRHFLSLALSLFAGSIVAPVFADEPQWRHGHTLIGELKYPKDFQRFDYVNPDAPKGGQVRIGATGGYDTFNSVVPKGRIAAYMNFRGPLMSYERLMISSLDEPSTEYGRIAEAVKYPADYSYVVYRLNPKARWHDGKPITPEDVIWSFDVQKKHDPHSASYYKYVEGAEKTGEHEITFKFSQVGNRELPQIVGQLPVLPKHWWTSKDADGKPRDITKTSLEPPLGSGPYKIGEFKPGKFITFERVVDYWAKDEPFAIGHYNFDELKVDYYLDPVVQFQAFKSDLIDYRSENTAKRWAIGYDFPAVREGRVIRKMIPDQASGSFGGFALNMRRKPFDDVRVRKALNYAYNFEEMNRTIFYEQYSRRDSYFYGIDLAAKGAPSEKELELLKGFKTELNPAVLEPINPLPISGDRRAYRKNLREAIKLMQEAGFKRDGTQMVNAETGDPLEVEMLYVASPSFERIGLALQADWQKLGVKLKLRAVDSAQYEARFNKRDYDMITFAYPQSLSPGNEQLEFFGSEAADREGSYNVMGIKDPALDEAIEKLIQAKARDDVITATKVVDRILLAGNYYILGWDLLFTRLAYWNRFSHPDPLPIMAPGINIIWWYDEEKAAKTGAPKGASTE